MVRESSECPFSAGAELRACGRARSGMQQVSRRARRARAERHLVPVHPLSVSHPGAVVLLELGLLKGQAVALWKSAQRLQLRNLQRISGDAL